MDNLRNIPAVDEILGDERIKDLSSQYNRQFVVTIVRQAVENLRLELKLEAEAVSKKDLIEMITQQVLKKISASKGTLYKVINGTGVVLHTNLGRAPLGNRAVEYIKRIKGD